MTPLGLRGIIGTPALVEFFGEFYEACHGGGCGGDAEDFVVQGTGDVLAEGVHFCGLIGAGARGVRGPFLIPVGEQTDVHFEGVHDIGQVHDRFDKDEVCFKSVLEGLPGAKVDGVCCEGGFLTIFCPFSHGCTKFKVCESRRDSFAFERVDVGIEIVVVDEAGSEGVCFRG